jgi:hypothetical protein
MNKKTSLAAQVAEDMRQESGDWIQAGTWVVIVMADPIYYGRLSAISATHYYLEDACWIPDVGRKSEFVKNPSNAPEVEYIGEIAVERPCVALYRIKNGRKLDTK